MFSDINRISRGLLVSIFHIQFNHNSSPKRLHFLFCVVSGVLTVFTTVMFRRALLQSQCHTSIWYFPSIVSTCTFRQLVLKSVIRLACAYQSMQMWGLMCHETQFTQTTINVNSWFAQNNAINAATNGGLAPTISTFNLNVPTNDTLPSQIQNVFVYQFPCQLFSIIYNNSNRMH